MRARAAASVALTAVVAALLAGCGFWVPVATQDPYNPSDGVNGEIDVFSFGADGQPGGEDKNADIGSWQ